MASKRIIEVRIKGSLNTTTAQKKEPKNDLDTETQEISLIEHELFKSAFNQVVSQLSEMAMYGINRHLELTDNYVGERYLNAGIQVINRAKSTGIAIAAGFKIGGVIGAVIGAAFSLVDMTFDTIKNYDQEFIKIRQMDTQLDYQRQRAGYSLTSGSIGENK